MLSAGDADAAVDDDGLAGDEVRALDEAEDELRHVLRLADGLERRAADLVRLAGLVDLVAEAVAEPARLDEARARRR